MKGVIDASFVASLILPDEQSERSEATMRSLSTDGIAVPALWQLEVTNLLLMAERRKRISAAIVRKLSDAIDGLPVTIEPPLTVEQRGDVLNLARTHQLTAYDSAYLELTLRLGGPLATLDAALRKAAVSCGVTVW